MSHEKPTPDEFAALAPEDGWPLGMFPSEIVSEHFDPYDNPEDRRMYYLLGGNKNEILKRATIKKLREMRGEPGGYSDAAEAIESVQQSSEYLEQKRRIQQHPWPDQP